MVSVCTRVACWSELLAKNIYAAIAGRTSPRPDKTGLLLWLLAAAL